MINLNKESLNLFRVIAVFSVVVLVVFFLPSPSYAQVYKAHIMGEFRGWTGNSVYPLEEGGLLVQRDLESDIDLSLEPEVLLVKRGANLIAFVGNSKNGVIVDYMDKYYRGIIKGSFHGWDGSSIYELMDGHVIKQANYTYDYSYYFDPKVFIFPYGGNNRIVVDEDNTSSLVFVDFIK